MTNESHITCSRNRETKFELLFLIYSLNYRTETRNSTFIFSFEHIPSYRKHTELLLSFSVSEFLRHLITGKTRSRKYILMPQLLLTGRKNL